MLHESPNSDPKAVNANLASKVETQANTPPRNTIRRCTMCGKTFPFNDPKLAPFCSVRCQQIDLGNWLGEAYGMPWEDPAGGESLEREQEDD